MPKGTPFEIGTKVAHRQSGMTGTVTGKPIPARSAGGALMQRVIWDHGFKQNPEGSSMFVRDLIDAEVDFVPSDM